MNDATKNRNPVQARVLAWDIYRQWDLWVESCCPAEEERLRRRGRAFDDPEEFKHDDQVAALVPRPNEPVVSPDSETAQKTDQQRRPAETLPVSRNGYASSTSGVGTPDDIVVVEGEGDGEKNACRKLDRSSSLTSSGNNVETSIDDSSPQHNGDAATKQMDTPERASCDVSTGTSPLLTAAAAGVTSRNQSDDTATCQEDEEVKSIKQDNDEDDNDDEDFKPTSAMNPRAIVRERRQWALRRARRREGPNEANQLELGGGWLDDMFCEIRVAGAAGEGADAHRQRVDTADGGGGGGGGRSVVALLVSLLFGWWLTARRSVPFDVQYQLVKTLECRSRCPSYGLDVSFSLPYTTRGSLGLSARG